MKTLSILTLILAFACPVFAQNPKTGLDSLKNSSKVEIFEQLETRRTTIRNTVYLEYNPKTAQILKNRSLSLAKQRALQDNKLRELILLIEGGDEDKMVTSENFAYLVKTKFRTLSGTDVKNGKYIGQSLAIDAKTATANFSIKPFSREFYITPNISGTAKDSFVDLFSDGKYNKTLSGGINFIMLSNLNRAIFRSKPQKLVRNVLFKEQNAYNKTVAESEYNVLISWVNELKAILEDSSVSDFISQYQTDLVDTNSVDLDSNFKKLEQYNIRVDTLIKADILPKEFVEFSVADQYKFISGDFSSIIEQYTRKKYLDRTDKIQQQNAVYKLQHIIWFSGGLKYNVAQFNVIDPVSTSLKKDFKDEYFSYNFGLSWTMLFDKGHRIYSSPTLTLKNSHPFNSANELHLQQTEPYAVGSNSLQNITKDLSVYPSVPDRMENWSLDVPFAYYKTKWKFGFEIAFRKNWNDPENDNLGMRAGILLPFNQGEGNVLVVEPLLRFIKLNQNTDELWKNNAIFGFNLSVTIPKELFK